MPADWVPTLQHAALAKREGRNLAKEEERFRNNAEAKGLVYISWNAAFSTWLTSEYGRGNGNGGSPANRLSDESVAAQAEKARRFEPSDELPPWA